MTVIETKISQRRQFASHRARQIEESRSRKKAKDDFKAILSDPSKSAVTVKQWDESIKIVGPRLWKRFHDWAATGSLQDTDRWLASFKSLIPIASCTCRADFETILRTFPPDISSLRARADWSVGFHNFINGKLGKPMFSFADADRLYGWGFLPIDRTEAIFCPKCGKERDGGVFCGQCRESFQKS